LGNFFGGVVAFAAFFFPATLILCVGLVAFVRSRLIGVRLVIFALRILCAASVLASLSVAFRISFRLALC
jgi:hypothetical protein